MRRAAFAVVAVVLTILAFSLTASPARAQSGDCVQACADQWYTDKSECLARLNATLATIAAAEDKCISECAPGNFLCQGLCSRNANIKRGAANNDYRRCVNRANTTAWNCYRACEISKGRPR